jgi:epoxyqueuosine reductase
LRDTNNTLGELLSCLRQGKMTRRAFLRYAAALGLTVGAAEALAACAPQPSPTAEAVATGTPVPTPSDTPNYHGGYPPYDQGLMMDRETMAHGGEPLVKEVPTFGPPPTVVPAAPTPTPVMWQGTAWTCPVDLQQFATQDELVQHVLTAHTVKVPGARRVDKPTYAHYLTDKVARFDQKNDVFCRAVWDQEYQASLFTLTPRKRPETPQEMQEGRARVAGGIYADQVAGSLVPGYGGYFGHLQGVHGLYDWDDAVTAERLAVSDAAAMSEQVKAMARLYGADLVGITEINPLWVYSHYFDRATGKYGSLELPLKYAVVMGIEMDFSSIRKSPGFAASAAVAKVYSNMAEVSSKLAKYIRGLGWEALPSGNDTTQSIPLAIDAGLGELGRLGLLLTPEYGARQRICKVYTDLPLAVDKPIDFGMQRFCETCQFCAHACPVQAIPRGQRSYELTSISNRPGILRWHVDTAKCFQFWVMNGGSLEGLSDCANCIAACPWSQQSRPWL